MDTLEIDKQLADVKPFLGAFAYDLLPGKPINDFSVVINTSISTLPGDHWLLLLRKKEKLYFIDSYGRNLNDSTFDVGFVKVMKDYLGNEKIYYNKRWLQQLTSNTCGAYCIYFIRELGKRSFSDCLSIFSEDLVANDKTILDYLSNLN